MTDADLRELVKQGRTIEAIRRWRDRHGANLIAARAAIETIRWELTQKLGPQMSAFEAEIDQLLRSDQKIAAIKRFLRSDQKIAAIKRWREHTGVGLKEAKDAVEARAAATRK